MKKRKKVSDSPISVSDLLSISVSVRVRTEFERLDMHELWPDLAPLPQRSMVRSRAVGSWFSVGTVPLV